MPLTILSPGPLTTVQDEGRFGHLHAGIGRSGAMDARAYRAANALVGNARGEAVLEATLMGPTIRFEQACSIALTGADIATDLPKYRVYEHGAMVCERTDVSSLWRDDLVSFLIGCSFSFEADLLEAGIPVRHIEEGRNVPMYITNIPCAPAGAFHGNMVVSMRPMSYSDAIRSIQITGAMPRVHGAPVHFGDPAVIGIRNIDRPDFGDAVTIRPGEIPVFWPCGVTPQAALMQSKPAFAITHAPGHMLITDVKNICLKY